MRLMLAVPALVCVFSVGAAHAQDPPDLIFIDGFELLGPGDACAADERCASGTCVDGVCCNTSCEGVCTACDVASALGTCSPIPAGTDPDGECGSVSCSTYYWGWSGDTCYRKADVAADEASCGTGACRTAAQECGHQTQPGPPATTCHTTCQDPNPITCSGTTPGSCTNVNPGNQSCGDGVCHVTVPQCVSGAPNTCTPNWAASTTETCNDIDDNCDGTIDNGAFADAQEPNVDCNTFRTLNGVGSDGTRTYNTLTIYPQGDADYFRFTASETDSSCGCGGFPPDEDYEVIVTLTVPAGGGSYQICTGVDCNSWASCLTVAAGTSGTARFYLDGECGITTDSYPIYVRVIGSGAPGFECRPYTLSYTFDAGLCR
jgi:hypothetical protein